MKDRVLISTIAATIVAAASFLGVGYLMKRSIDWPSIVIYAVVFAVAFYITQRLFFRKSK